MPILSIQSLLKPVKPRPPDFIGFLHLLLDGVSLRAAPGAAEDVKEFRAEIDGASARLTEQSSSEEILLAIGVMNHALEEHNRRSSGFTNAHINEMRTMLSMMSSTVAFLASSSKAGLEQLQGIEGRLRDAAEIEDVHLVRLKLAECLTVVREESSRLADDTRIQIENLNEGLKGSTALLTTPPSRTLVAAAPGARSANDPTTGLPTRSEAEQMIASSIAGGKESVICIFLVDRLAALNSRFGRKVGDEILLLVAEHLGRKLPDTSPPFRWSGPAFVAVVGGASQRTEFQIKKIATTKLEKSFEANGRSVLLPISFSVRLQPLTTRDCTETIFDTIDRLIAAHSGEAR